ncbi:MAG TPA: hypothetical protein VH518_23000 [Tepidisphaeraceae bacterium]|jgi:hypothetical protein
MLLQTNSYKVPKERRAEHARLLARFRQTLARLGCDHFEAYEQVGANWGGGESTGRFVQIMRFRDRKHQQQVQQAEKSDPQAQALIKEFCDLINFPEQQQLGQFAVGFYSSVMAVAPTRAPGSMPEQETTVVAPSVPQQAQPPAEVVAEVDADAEDALEVLEPAPPRRPLEPVKPSDTAPPSDNGHPLNAIDELAIEDAEIDPEDISPSDIAPVDPPVRHS